MPALVPPRALVATGPNDEDSDDALVSAAGARPFGLTRATRLVPADVKLPTTLTVCPERQITVTEDGTPFVLAPAMETQIQTTVTTKEDNQTWDDDQGTDTDPQDN